VDSPGAGHLTPDGSQQLAQAWSGQDKLKEQSCGEQNTPKPCAAEEVPRLQVVWRLEECSVEVLHMLLHSSLLLSETGYWTRQTLGLTPSHSSFLLSTREMNSCSLPNSKNRGQISQDI